MKWLKNRFVVVSFLALMVFLGLAGIRFSGGLQMMELSIYDRLLTLKADSKVASPIVICSIMSPSIAQSNCPNLA